LILRRMNIFKYYLKIISCHKSNKSNGNIRIKNISFIIPYIKKQKRAFIIAFFLLVINSALILPSPAITGNIIDNVFVRKNMSELSLLVIILFILLFSSNFINIFQEYYFLRLSKEFIYSIRGDLFEKILKLPFSIFSEFQTGYLVSRTDEVNQLGRFFSSTLLYLISDFIKFFGALFFLLHFNSKLTLISLIAMPLFFEISRRYIAGIRASSVDVLEKGARVREIVQESFSGIELIKTFAKEKKEVIKIKKKMRDLLESEIIQNLFSSISGRILGLVTGINLLIILWVSGYEIFKGRFTVGQYVAFVGYINFLYGPVQLLASTYLGFQNTIVACERIAEFFHSVAEDENPNRTYEIKKIAGEIEFKNVYYNYGNGRNCLDDISFTIKAEEKVAIVGASGAGKSTLINLILGLYEPRKGKIFVDGKDLKNITLASLRNKIGIVSQNIFLFNDTILDNIKYSRTDATIEDVIDAARASGAHEFIARLPYGYNTNAGEIGKKLSAGEKQRISIARAILKNPDVIIFDEPTAHLDNIMVKVIYESMKELFKYRTCIIISHHLIDIAWVDHVIVLEDGKISQDGKHEDLINKIGRYHELFQG